MKVPVLLLALLLPGALMSLATEARAETDAQLWTKLGVEHSLSKKTDIGFAQHLRFSDNISQVHAVMPEVSGTHKVMRWLRLGAEYRFAYKRSGSGDFVSRHRFGAEAKARLELDRLDLDARSAWQLQLRGIDASDGTRHTWRNRLSAGTKVSKKLDAGVSAEMFHAVGDGNGIVLSELRFMGEVEFDLKKAALEVGLGLEVPVADDTAPTLVIFAVGYEFDL